MSYKSKRSKATDIPKKFKENVWDRDDELIKNIENRVRYFLTCIDDKIEPSENGYKEWLNES